MTDMTPRGPRRAVSTGATRARGRARSVLRPSGPPTLPISVRATGDRVSEWHTRAVIDLVLRLGEAMLVTGASVADTTAAVLRVCRAYGLTSVHADITYTSITLSFHRGVHRDPITVMRIISRFGTDYSRLESLQALARDICADPDDPGDIEDNLHELERILELPNAYRRGIVTAAWAGMGAGVAALLGAGVSIMIVAALTTAVIDRTQHAIARLGISAFFGQVLGAMIATTVTVALRWARSDFPDVGWLQAMHPSIVVASCIVALLSGMSVVTAAQDTLDGFYVTASARTYEVVLLTGGIVAGVLTVLVVAQNLNIHISVVPSTAYQADSLMVQLGAAAIIAGSYAISAYCGPIAVLVSIATGAGSWLVYSMASSGFGFSGFVSAGLAAFVVGAIAPTTARNLHIPSISITTAGVMPLLPGQAVYKAIIFFVQDKSGETSMPMVSQAVLTGLALSAGVSLGTLLGRQVLAGQNSVTAKVLGRTVANVPEN